tara:strand:- start:886 stop:1314 length:429 start_codon:yes stop_codon:yes gene_type:complete
MGNNETRYDFASEEWVAIARDYLEEQTRDVDLSGISVSFNEVFSDAPSHLNPNVEGKIGWYIRVADGSLEVRTGILPDPDLRASCDYETVLPAVRRLSTDPPLDDAMRQVLTNSIVREGNENATADLDWMRGLHDVMAVRSN